MSKKQRKFIFTLPGIDIEKITQKYGIGISEYSDDKPPQYTTKLTELFPNKTEFSFSDEAKKTHTCKISVIDFSSGRSVQLLRYNCFWCRNPFDTKPLGVPIKWISRQAVKMYHSHISKDVYTIKENISKFRENHLHDPRVCTQGEAYYESNGVVCSWDCMAAFIEDNKHNPLYRHSKSLMLKMYSEITGKNVQEITPAPHWNQLIEYGGWRTILDFREGFSRADYISHGILKPPEIISISHLYEEIIKF